MGLIGACIESGRVGEEFGSVEVRKSGALSAVLTAALGLGLIMGAPVAGAAVEPSGPDSPATVVPGNDPNNPAVPTDAAVRAEVAPGEQVTVNVAVQLDDGNVRIESREATGPAQALAEIKEAAAEPDVVAADVAKPVESFAGDPYRVEVIASGLVFPGQYGLSMMCTDADALVLNPNCGTEYSYQFATGSGQVIAVLDEPVQTNHPDLAANMLGAISCLSNPCAPTSYNAGTAAQHGTHVAGIAAAVTDNGIGVAGQAKGAKIQPITVLTKGGSGDTGMLARGIAQATASNVDVINMSLGFYTADEVVKAAVAAAIASGINVVAAAGNAGVGAQVTYPAAYDGVIGVGAVAQNFTAWSGSSRGYWVDLVAPGADFILSTWPSSDQCLGNSGTVLIATGYCYQRGTSMATPFVAGAVAQMLQYNPTLTPAQVTSYLTSNAFDLGGPGRDDTYGYGFPDLTKTFKAMTTAPERLSYAPGDQMVTVGFQAPTFTGGLPILRYEYSIDGGEWTTAASGRTASPLSLSALTAGGTPLVNGTEYSVQLRAVTANGPGVASQALMATPSAPVPTEFVAIDPVRVYDSRWTPPIPGLELGPLANSTVTPTGRAVSVLDGRSSKGAVTQPNVVPLGASAVAYNLTATGQTTSGFLSVTPGSTTSAPNASVINWTSPQQTRANGFISAIDAEGRLRVFGGGNGTTQFIVDIVGYYKPQIVTSSGDGSATMSQAAVVPEQAVFVALEKPLRAYDSRWVGVPGVVTGAISGANSPRDISIKDSRDGSGAVLQPDVVPAGATGVAYNLTVTGTTGTGYLAMAPGGQEEPPAVSTINWSPGITMANATSGKIAADRTMRVFAASGGAGGTSQFIVDIVGYFIPISELPVGTEGARFVSLPPLRAYDSRFSTPSGPLDSSQPRTTSAALDRGVPDGSTAVAFNLTITGNAGSGYVEVVPGGAASSGTSTINWFAPTTIANGSVVGVNDAREQTSYVGGRFSTNYLIDIAGYFTPAAVG